MHESLCRRQIDGRAAHLCQGTQCLRAALIGKSAALAFERSESIELSIERCRDVDKYVRYERRCNGRGVPVGFTHRFVTEYLTGCLRTPRPRGNHRRQEGQLMIQMDVTDEWQEQGIGLPRWTLSRQPEDRAAAYRSPPEWRALAASPHVLAELAVREKPVTGPLWPLR